MDAAALPLIEALRERGDAAFLAYDDRDVSAAAVLAAVEHAAEEAAKLPFALAPGDVVALRGGDPALRVAAPLAAWTLGLCTQLVSDREPEAAVERQLESSGARCVLGWRVPGIWSLLPLAPQHEVQLPAGTLLATSGSAGHPKLVAHALEHHVASAREACAFLDLGSRDRLLLSLPTYNAGGLALLFRAILSGAVLCAPGAGSPLAAAIARHRPTHISLVATQLARLLEDGASAAALRACRAVLVGGGPIPVRLREEALAADVPLVVTYGATETAAFVAASADPEINARAQSAGRPLPRREVRLDDEGEIRIGGPTLFSGYLVDGALQGGRDDDGLWATGDLGRFENGVLYVTGRKDRMFVSGGENVQPEEIESALLGLAAVDEAVVVPAGSPEFGARPVAFVAGEALDAATLDASLRAVLPGFKTPDAYYRMPPHAPARLKPDIQALAAFVKTPEDLERL